MTFNSWHCKKRKKYSSYHVHLCYVILGFISSISFFSYITKVSCNESILTINDISITFNWYISIIGVSKWWNKWDAGSQVIDHDNLFSLRCWDEMWDSKTITKPNVSLLSLKHLYIQFKRFSIEEWIHTISIKKSKFRWHYPTYIN